MTSRSTTGTRTSARRVLTEDLDGSVGWVVSDTARHVRRLLHGRIAKLGIRGGSWFVLRALWVRDGVTQGELADRLGITQPSALEMVRSMQAQGLVRFERDLDDRRKLRIHVTEDGLALKAPALKLAHDANRVLLSDLSHDEEETLKMLLRRVRHSAATAIESDQTVSDEPTVGRVKKKKGRSVGLAEGGIS